MAGTLYPGNASVGQVLNSQVFSAGTNYDVPGTMPNQGAVTITPSSASQAIPAGYHSGAGVVNAVTFDATKVLTGTTIAGTAGTMSNFGSPTWTPGTASQSLSAGYYSGGTVAGDANLVAGNIKSGVSIFGVAGSSSVVDTTVSNGATASQILNGQKAYVNGALVTGTIPSVAGGNTITPGTASQTAIASATYATSAITVAGDANLVSANIRAGSSIFGVAGATNVVDTTLATGGATAGQILSGQMGFVNGAKVTGTIPSVAGGNTITPGTASITAINAGTYATSAITVAGDANLVSANIKAGKSIFGVSGATNVVDTTYQTSGTGNVAVSASKMLTGFTAFVNGASVAGSVPIVAGGNTITPSTGAQTAIGAGTYATSAVTVAGDTNLVSANIKAGTSIFGVAGATNVVDTTYQTSGSGNVAVSASKMLTGFTAFVNGASVAGSVPIVAGGNTITPGTASQTAIPAGNYATSAITVAGDANLVSGNIKAGTSIFGVAGATNVVDTTLSTGGATAGQILNGQSGFVNGAKVTGTIPSVSGGTTTPTTANQTVINSGSYVTSNVVVAGDANLVTGNIRSGVSIFGVAGKSSVVDTASANATASQILNGQTAYVNGALVTGSIPSQSATTVTPGTANQTGIPAGTYASGAVTVAGDTNLVSGNIKSGVSIFGVSGKVSVVDTSPGSATAGDILVNYSAYVNGVQVLGSMPNNGALNYTYPVGQGGIYNIPAGYTSGGQIISPGWATYASDPYPRNNFGSAYDSSANLVYAMDGNLTAGAYGYSTAFSYSSNAWTTLSNDPINGGQGRYDVGASYDPSANLTIVADGYYSGGYQPGVTGYSHSSNAWSTLASDMSRSKISSAYDSSAGLTYMTDGYNSSTSYSTWLTGYSHTSNTWTSLTGDQYGRGYLGSAYDSSANLTYNSGGTGGSAESVFTSYSKSTNAWTALKSMPDSRYGHGCVYDPDDNVTIITHGTVGSTYVNTGYVYSHSSNSYTSTPNGITIRTYTKASYNTSAKMTFLLDGIDTNGANLATNEALIY